MDDFKSYNRESPIQSHRDISSELTNIKYSFMHADEFYISPALNGDMRTLWSDWDDLGPDNYLKNNAQFRTRRFANFYFLPRVQEIRPLPHAAYFQDSSINSYAGGIQRMFAPLKEETLTNIFLHELIKFNFQNFPVEDAKADDPWNIDVHQIRITATADMAGNPTPEGIHHDENDFICMHLANRQNTVGGVSSVYDLEKRPLAESTLINTMDSVILHDPCVMHSVSPIRPQNPGQQAIRDMLLIGYNHAPALKCPPPE